ncbi:ABC transporter substrate-binding protein [Planomonospora parontospora]|uniref:ABC transporter substrate-binding protein n=1 Tax=Planomonospora parontospora TaxID=58119 RepID=UPI001671312B|nr:extracellular solute-binding protein [Planomonospora parontospora]GGL51305.1 sugar-binding protein [Planomonospora parontospora subsp. antibiotica]GII19089.1 sugar-binding protein [Planomonospora parontospora subsp. antibiotica]
MRRSGYRETMGALLVAGLGLSAAACGSDESARNGARPAQSAGAPAAGNAPVSISINCVPPKTNKAERQNFEADMAEFQKLNPDIKIEKASDAFPCYEPRTFEAKLAGGQLETVFYANFPNVGRLMESGQAADITPYLDTVKTYGDLNGSVEIFKKDGRVYGVPTDGYGMGLVYNRKVFTQAGLDPNNPPRTWAEVQAAAKKIAALGPGYVGFGEYSGGNTGGWHFTASIYGRGGDVITPDGRKAAFNTPEGRAVLENLKQMRWADDSMGSRLFIKWEDLMKAMAGGRMGMMLGAPDVLVPLRNDFQAKFEDYAAAAQPEAKALLNGGKGFMINPKATPEQIRAGLKWIEFQYLTPGKGQLDYERAKSQDYPVGQPYPDLWKAGSATGTQVLAAREQYATVDPAQYARWVEGSRGLPAKPEPGPYAQEIYAILDTPMSAVLTRKDADVDRLLADAEAKVNALLAKKG